MITLIGLGLIFSACTAGIATALYKVAFEEEDLGYEYDVPDFKRLGSAKSLAGFTGEDQSAYIKALQDQITQLQQPQTSPSPFPLPSEPVPTFQPEQQPAALAPAISQELPYDAPSNRLKLKDLILRGIPKGECLREVYSVKKNGRPGSKYQLCSQLWEELKAECEQEIRDSLNRSWELEAAK